MPSKKELQKRVDELESDGEVKQLKSTISHLEESVSEAHLKIGALGRVVEDEHKEVVRLTKENRVLRDKSSVTAEVQLPVRPSTR